MSPHLVSLLLGMAGNAAVEVAVLLGQAHRGRYHRKYATARFWVLRGLMVVLVGVMALAYSLSGLTSPFLAFHVGVAGTLLIDRLKATPPAP